jgi:hypothetical protein
MPESAFYLLFALVAVLVVGGIVRPHRLGNAAKSGSPSIRDRLRAGLHRYRWPGLVLGAMAVGLVWYAVSPPPAAEHTLPEPAANPPAALEDSGSRVYESEFIEIELPGGWTANDVSGLGIPDLDSSQLPKAYQVSIAAIPMRNDDLHLFAFDKDFQTTLLILANDTDAATVSTQLDRRWVLYTWIGVPVSETRTDLVIDGNEAGTMVLEPMHRFELFREKQYLVATDERTYTLVFSTLARFYQNKEPMFEEIAGSFRVLPGS